MTNTVFVASAMAAAIALAGCAGMARQEPQTAQQTARSEKCFGVAQAGKNDCAGAAHACKGQSQLSRSPDDFIVVPAGTCDKLVGGMVKA